MAQTWPRGFCKYNTCDASTTKPFKFTIHGLWPSDYGKQQPEFCSVSKNSSIYLTKELVTKLDQDWPSYTTIRTNKEFWSHEWSKHGSCSNMSEIDYFKLALDIYANNDIQQILGYSNILPGNTYEVNKIILAIRTSPIGVEPQLKCENGDLIEIRLCLNNNPIPQYINCPSRPSSTCPINVSFI
ncbi:hypothetical protein LR48_Vigan09g046600 [Vigna angularis]|nr:uncharacterized protein LOC128197578 [Vigna angularis]KOM51807.1 hypothetical protein LR48_Vigan09g046600 [Vigna angularis]